MTAQAAGSVHSKTVAAAPRLLFVMNSPIFGGAERHTFDLATALSGRGAPVAIFCMKAGPMAAPEGVPLLQPDRNRSLPQRIGDLRRTLDSFQPDLVIAVNERPVLAATAARAFRRRRVPIAMVWHSTMLRTAHERRMQMAYGPMINRIESVVFISANQQAFWSRNRIRPRRSALILNGIDAAHFTPAARAGHRDATRASLGLAPSDIVLGLCAVMRPEKNHLQLIEAAAALRREGLPVRVLLVGDGPQRAAIEARVTALGLQDAVILAGMHRDVRPFLAAFDIGVLCSTAIETLSLAALEVMAMGVPMVMSDLGGASEIVDGTNGRLFPTGDGAALVSALRSLCDPGVRERAGLAARATVERHFGRDAMIDGYAAHIAELTGRRS